MQVKCVQIRFCESTVFITATQKWPATCRLWAQGITRKHGLTNCIWSLQQSTLEVRFHIRFKWGICVCDKIVPANMYLYCKLSRNWRWHYMRFAWAGQWNWPCKPIVLPHIGITWVWHWSIHETAHINHCLATHWYYMGFTLVDPWNCTWKATVFHTLHWSTLGAAHVKTLSCHTFELPGSTLVGPWSCPCKTTVLPLIGIAWGSH